MFVFNVCICHAVFLGFDLSSFQCFHVADMDFTERKGHWLLIVIDDSHWAHDVAATLNHWRWFNVATTSCAQWDAGWVSFCTTQPISKLTRLVSDYSFIFFCTRSTLYILWITDSNQVIWCEYVFFHFNLSNPLINYMYYPSHWDVYNSIIIKSFIKFTTTGSVVQGVFNNHIKR